MCSEHSGMVRKEAESRSVHSCMVREILDRLNAFFFFFYFRKYPANKFQPAYPTEHNPKQLD